MSPAMHSTNQVTLQLHHRYSGRRFQSSRESMHFHPYSYRPTHVSKYAYQTAKSFFLPSNAKLLHVTMFHLHDDSRKTENDTSISFPVNLAILKTFFDDFTDFDIKGDTLTPDPVEIIIPTLLVDQQEAAQHIAKDDAANLDLAKLVNKMILDEKSYRSLGHCIRDRMTETSDTGSNSFDPFNLWS